MCHGCYDAPCQLDLSAPEGIERGASKDLVYNAGRLLAMEPTRLFVDARSPAAWREKQFSPVLKRLSRIQGAAVSWVPQNIIVSISASGSTDPGDSNHQVMTLIHNNGLSNVSHLFFEQERRIPAEDTLTVVPGFLGAHPNALYHVGASQLQDFVSAVETLRSEEDYQALVGHFGISRSDPDFWKHSDALRIAYQKESPIETGLLDYNRLENW